MNVALIRPQKISGSFEKILIQEPINLAYIASFLKANRISVEIWDFEVEPFREKKLKEKVKKNHIDIVGITSMTPTINNAHKIAMKIKQANPSTITVAGGPHVSALAQETLSNFPYFDYVVTGEGEITMFQLCQNIKGRLAVSDIPGLAYRDQSRIIVNNNQPFIDDLDQLPFPARELFKQNLYKIIYAAGINISGKKSTVIFTSRGCPQNCTFCTVKKTLGQRVRFRSTENVLSEINQCINEFGYNHFTFEDTNLTLNRDRFLNICSKLKELNITWDCQTKVDLVDEQLIEIMRDAGCIKIAYGVESGSPKILKLMKKNIGLEQIKNAFKWTHKANIVACAFFILGSHPEETKQDIEQTEKLLHQIKPDVFQLGIICPYPGTEIFTLMKKEGLITEDLDWNKFNFMHSHPAWGTKHLRPEELVKYQKAIYIRYIISFAFFSSLFKRIFKGELLPLLKLCKHMLKYLIFEKRG